MFSFMHVQFYACALLCMRSQFIELQIILEIVAQIVLIVEIAFPKSRTPFVFLYYKAFICISN